MAYRSQWGFQQPTIMPQQWPEEYGYPMNTLAGPGGVVVDETNQSPPPYPGGGTGGLPQTPTGQTWSGWTPPNGSAYGPGSAPGYGTYTDPERMQWNLASDARAWLSQNSQIFNPYGGQMTAGPTGLQTAARQNLWDFLGSDPSAYTRQGANIASSVGGFQPQNVSGGSFTTGDWGAYMNPYTQNVIDTTMSDIDRQRQIANQMGARSAGASTYGGDRNALIEAETNRGYADIQARTLAQLRSQSFDSAAGLMGQDLQRGYGAQIANQQAGLQGGQLRLGAGIGLGQLGGQAFNQGIQGASALNQFGTQDQTTQQAELTNRYNEYMRSMYGPMEGYNFLGGLMSGASYATPGGPGAARGALGGALAGGGALMSTGNPWLIGGGALVGGLGGWLG